MVVKLIRLLTEALRSATVASFGPEAADLYDATPQQIVSVFDEFGPFIRVDELDDDEGRLFLAVSASGKSYYVSAIDNEVEIEVELIEPSIPPVLERPIVPAKGRVIDAD